MKRETLSALRGSIEKWKGVVKGKEEHGAGDCPLCHLFICGSPDCTGCPVSAATGQKYCRSTPYKEFHIAKVAGDAAEMKRHAKRELEFLQGLLP